MNWVKIIIYILILIAEGINKERAISKASNLFGVSIREIKKHL